MSIPVALRYPLDVERKSVDVKNVAVIGLGTVGLGIVEVLLKRTSPLLSLKKVVVRNAHKQRDLALPDDMLTTNVNEVLYDPQIDIVVEVIGGLDPATSIVMAALRQGKHVVTANKALIAENGALLFKEARRCDRQIGYRGTFVGCYTLLHHLSLMLESNMVRRVSAILNGTSNYVLSTMEETNCALDEALRAAQKLGYAEPDPTQDLDGTDTARKVKILLGLTSNSAKLPDPLTAKGVSDISVHDIRYAKELGYRIRLLGVIERANDKLYACVFPALVPASSMLGKTSGAYNFIQIEDAFGGESGLLALGAGRYPTAAAILRDLEDIANGVQLPMPEADSELRLGDPAELESKFYLRLTLVDEPGVLAKIADGLGRRGISISAVMQQESAGSAVVPVVMILHRTQERKVLAALQEIDQLQVVKDKTVIYQIYDRGNPVASVL